MPAAGGTSSLRTSTIEPTVPSPTANQRVSVTSPLAGTMKFGPLAPAGAVVGFGGWLASGVVATSRMSRPYRKTVTPETETLLDPAVGDPARLSWISP